MLMSFGNFLFELPSIVHQDLVHKREARFATNARLGAADAFQFIGPGPETITLTGVTGWGVNRASTSLAALNAIMQAGRAKPLVDGLGNVFGQYIARALDAKKTVFTGQGQAKRVEWALDLERADDPGAAIGNPLLDRVQELIGIRADNPLSIAKLGALF